MAASVGAVAAASTEGDRRQEEPKLILAITIDGLRGDAPFYAERFGPGGFRYLMEQGVVYDNAPFSLDHVHGGRPCHAAHPRRHPQARGLAGNDWHDARRGGPVYCVEDGIGTRSSARKPKK